MLLDPSVFSNETIPPEIAALNASILESTRGTPSFEELGVAQVRAARALSYQHGKDPTRYTDITIPSDNNNINNDQPDVGARIFFPPSSSGAPIQGALLHIHGGGFVFGTAYGQNDERLLRHAEQCHCTVVSIEYRLSPEHVVPAARDDCVTAALWMASDAGRAVMKLESKSSSSRPLLCVGESAGGTLAVAMLVRLRELQLGQTTTTTSTSTTAPSSLFQAVALVYGWYDLSELPFFRQWGDTRLVESADDLRWFRSLYLGRSHNTDNNNKTTTTVVDLKDPVISPFYADLSNLPPALFVIGTADALLDDSLCMHARWMASSGNAAILKVYPGAAHGMGHFGPHQHTEQGRTVLRDIEEFYKAHLNVG